MVVKIGGLGKAGRRHMQSQSKARRPAMQLPASKKLSAPLPSGGRGWGLHCQRSTIDHGDVEACSPNAWRQKSTKMVLRAPSTPPGKREHATTVGSKGRGAQRCVYFKRSQGRCEVLKQA